MTWLVFLFGCVTGAASTVLVYHYGVMQRAREEFHALRSDLDALRNDVSGTVSRLRSKGL